MKWNLGETQGYFCEFVQKYVRFVRSKAFFWLDSGSDPGLLCKLSLLVSRGGATQVLPPEGRPVQLVAKIGAGLSGPEDKSKELDAISGVRSPHSAILRIAWNHSLSSRVLADIDTPPGGTGEGHAAGSEETRSLGDPCIRT